MLTEGGYLVALLVYGFSALAAIALMNRWLMPGWRAPWRILVSLPIAGLLLTPAYTAPGGETLAPALVISAFAWLSAGQEAAQHALRPLLVFTGLASALGVLLAMLVAWRARRVATGD